MGELGEKLPRSRRGGEVRDLVISLALHDDSVVIVLQILDQEYFITSKQNIKD